MHGQQIIKFPHSLYPWCFVEESQLLLSGFGHFKLGKLGVIALCAGACVTPRDSVEAYANNI
jgi:hypothetical protein